MKTRILDEFVAVTGLHRKAAIRLLNGGGRPSGKKRSGRPRLYGLEAMAALTFLCWSFSFSIRSCLQADLPVVYYSRLNSSMR
jgi:hypothetical protein